MTRHMFGGDIAAYVIAVGSPETVGAITGNHTLLVPSQVVSFWTAITGGTQITDLVDSTGTSATTMTTGANGTIPQFSGPDDGTRVMWADASGGAGPRSLMVATDIGADLTTAETSIAAMQARVATVYAYDYGYRADGLSASAGTNTTAIQSAVNAAAAVQGRVVLPPGYGYITSPGIELPSRVWLQGVGHYSTVLQLADGANCDMIYNHLSTNGTSDPNGMFCGVIDLGLDARGAHQTGAGPYYGIRFNTNPFNTVGGADLAMDSTHVVQNVIVRNSFSDGIYINGRSDVRLLDCKVSFAGGNSYRLSFDTHAIGCISEKPSLAGFLVAGSSTQLTNCKSYLAGQSATSNNGQTGVPASGHGYVVTGTGVGEVTISGCDAQQNTGHGFHIAGGANGVTVEGCTSQEASYTNGTSMVAFNVDAATNCVISGTSKVDNSMSSVRLVNSADQCDVRVTHSLVTGQTTLGAAVSSDTVYLNNRVIVNGQAYSPVSRPWAATTAYTQGVLISFLGSVYQATSAFTSGATFATTNLVLVSAPMQGNPIPAGKFVFPGGGNNSSTANTLGIGSLRVYPFYLPHATTLTGIGAEVTVIGDAASKYRLGIYADTGGFQPGSLVIDAGTIAADSATVQTITISQALPAGVYWVAGVVQVVTTTQPTMRTTGPGAYALPVTTLTAGIAVAGYTHGSTVAGALPATFSVGGLTGSIPRIHLKG